MSKTLDFKCLSFALVLLTIVSFNGLVDSKKDRIKLKDVQTLTLRPNQWTTGRRSSSVPQLKCVGGYCDAVRGQTVQCYNKGSDGLDIQWECKSNIDSGYKFGSLDVICEGYDYPDDPYILVGSCGLEFTIEGAPKSAGSQSRSDYSYTTVKSKPSHGFSIGVIVCVGLVMFVVYKTCLRPNGATNAGRGTRGGPPPPGFRSDFFGSPPPDSCSGSSTSTGYSSHAGSGFTNQRTQTNGNGFWSGMLAGSTLGYLFGSRNTNYTDQSSYFGSRANPSNYFTEQRRRSPSPSPTTTTTTGFAGTKRR